MAHDVIPASGDAAPEGALRTFGLGVGPIAFAPPQPPGWSFLAWARSGALVVRTEHRAALADGPFAVWIPAGSPFAFETRGRCDIRLAYVSAAFAPARPFGAVVASGVLREILERSVVAGYLDPARARDARLIAVARDEFATLEPAPVARVLALPTDRRLRASIDVALRAPDERPSVSELAIVAGLTVRTFERRFAAQTGLTPRAWFRRARLHAASLALAAGATSTEAGLACGYASLSAFIAAYRRDFGASPGRALRRR